MSRNNFKELGIFYESGKFYLTENRKICVYNGLPAAMLLNFSAIIHAFLNITFPGCYEVK